MRVLAIIVIILGLASLVLGIMFIPQAASGEKEIKDSLAPDKLTIDKVDVAYDQIEAAYAQTPQTNPQYVLVLAERASLGLAKANIGTVKAVRTNGIVDIVLGLGLVLGGFVLLRKNSSAA
jgi:hypothetical protein